ncbi:hemolysin family protein [Halobacillus naozhouensis]|uniref:Hemolysin family protein n=1 Tax=Halobacillus naozhouensis TaxID=554880 RepID=A0ABY8J2P7_9BACI|nr:hemolysin family protein [Halobacillus naozhouensis]WFT75668.1 hemolysin family protein [Halobacillus naozhouensis]
MTIAIGTLIILIIINGFFAASEIALISLNDKKVKMMADSGDKKAKKLYHLISEPSRFLSTIQVGITLAGFLASAFAANFFAGPLAEALYNLGVPLSQAVLGTISVVIITVVLSYFTLVFGELVPKQLALQKGELISNIAATPLTWLFKVSLPIVKLLTFSTDNTVRLFGVDPNADNEEATEEDIRMLVDEGAEKGYIQKDESFMIKNIFEFNDKTVSDIMTHRTDLSVLSMNSTLQETVQLVKEEKYTRFPVFEESIDQIVGILHTKDLIQFLERREYDSFDLKETIRKPHYVLENQRVDVVLRDMQKNNMHIAIVLDEFGGTEGMITFEDVIEEIVGEIFSENVGPEISDEEITKIDSGKYSVAGVARLYQLNEVLETDLPTDKFETINGYLVDQIGYVPTEDEHPGIQYKQISFEVKEVADYRIEKVIATVEEGEEASEQPSQERS